MGLKPESWRLYLDANFFIEALEGGDASSALCWRLLSSGDKRSGLLVTSLLTLSEVLVLPLRIQPQGSPLASGYSDIIADAPRLSVRDIDRQVLIRAAQIRSQWHAGKLPDAIHLATASLARCTHLISADKKLCSAASERFDMTAVAPSGVEALLIEMEANG